MFRHHPYNIRVVVYKLPPSDERAGQYEASMILNGVTVDQVVHSHKHTAVMNLWEKFRDHTEVEDRTHEE